MADFRIRVIVDPKAAVAGADKVQRKLTGLGKQADRLRGQFATLFGATVIIAGFAAVTRTIANFEQTMSTVKAISGATEAQFVALTASAQELGATTRFTATQAGEGLLFLSRAGFTVNESLEAIGGTLNLAQAGALDLGRAADIASNVLQGFRLDTDQTNRVVDVLAFTANNANTNVSQLGQALSFAAPVAAGLGVTLEQTSAAIAALSNAGIQSTRAGTGLVRVMAELESPTAASREIFARLGVTLDEVRISEVGLEAALKTLAAAGITTGQALEVFGKRGGPAFEVLASSIPTVEGMSKELLNVDGTAAEVAATMDDNLNGALLRVKSAAEAIVLAFGQLGGSDFLRSFFEGLATILRGVANNMDTVIRVTKALVIVLGAQLAKRAIPAAIAGFQALTRSVIGFTLAIAANPLGALVVAITAIIALLVSFGDKIKIPGEEFVTLRDVAVATFEFIRDALTIATEAIRAGFGRALAFVTDAFAGLNLTLGDVLSFIKTFVNRWIGLFVGLGRVIALIFKKVRDTILAFVGPDFFKNVVGAVTAVIDFAKQGLAALISFAQKGLNLIGVAIESIASQLGEELELPEFTFPEEVRELGAEIRDEFLKGFDQDFIGDLLGITGPALDAVLARARELAAARQGEPGAAPAEEEGGRLGGAAIPPPGGGVATDLQAVLDNLEQQKMLLGLTNQERQIATQLLAIEEELTRSLTEAETALVTVQLEELQNLQLQSEILNELRGPQEEFKNRQEALNQLFADGKISLSELNSETLLLKQRMAEADNTITGGISAGFLELANRSKDLGKNVQNFVVGAFDKATDALIEFATTGKFEFRAFVADLLKQLAKLALQQAIAGAFSAAFGGGGGAGGIFGGLFGGGGGGAPAAQNGLDTVIGGSGGTDSQLVAFRGTPGERVQVTTPGQQNQPTQPIVVQAPPVNITNVQNPDDIPLGIESAEGEQAVLNVLSRNSEAIRVLTGG